MRSAFLLAAIAMLAVGAAVAQSDLSGSYFCTEEFGGGMAYNETAEQWIGTSFRPSDRFVVTVERKLDQTLATKGYSTAYAVNVAHMSEPTYSCNPIGRAWDDGVIAFDGDAAFSCMSYLVTYKFNLHRLRFLSYYAQGFVTGEDGLDTPSMTGGTCAKID